MGVRPLSKGWLGVSRTGLPCKGPAGNVAGMSDIDLHDLAPGDADWLIERHATHYAASDGFDATFEALVAEILTAYIRDHDATRERDWIAWRDGARVGSIFCVDSGEAGVAKLRLFYVDPAARGTGLGHRLLETCVKGARDFGYRRMVLWTHESHAAAGHLYRSHGFALDSAVPVHSFGVDLVEQSWSITL